MSPRWSTVLLCTCVCLRGLLQPRTKANLAAACSVVDALGERVRSASCRAACVCTHVSVASRLERAAAFGREPCYKGVIFMHSGDIVNGIQNGPSLHCPHAVAFHSAFLTHMQGWSHSVVH